RPVALKILPPINPKDKPALNRFYDEVKALIALGSHPHVVTFHAIGITDDTPWLAMEFLPASLAMNLADSPAPPAEVSKLLLHVASALAHMHSREPAMLHNDLKPANILLSSPPLAQ